jgi:hypothetical protein
MGMFLKIVFHMTMTVITGGIWLLGMLIWFFIKK